MSLDIKSTKILVAFLFGVLRLFFGLLPVKLYKIVLHWEGEFNQKRHQQVTCALALCQSFGGGVLFATAFLHMMPDVYFSLEELKKNGNLQTEYPLSQLTISVGFFLVYFIEEFSHWFVTKVPDVPVKNHKRNNTMPSLSSSSSSMRKIDNRVTPVKTAPTPSAFIISNDDKKLIRQEEENEFVIPMEKNFEDDNFSVNTEVVKENERNEELITKKTIDDATSTKSDEIDEEVNKSRQQCVRYMLVVAALSLHAIFEGLAIGLQHSIPNIWYLFTAVSIHSATILFYISLELILAHTKLISIYVQVVVLATTSPIGVLLGLVISLRANMNTQAKSLAVILLEGLSAGTILYITFFEVLNREKERRIYRLRRALCILAGFGLMAMLQCIEIHFE